MSWVSLRRPRPPLLEVEISSIPEIFRGRYGRHGTGKSPKSPRSFPAAAGMSSKSPGAGRSPRSLAGMSDKDLKKLKEEVMMASSAGEKVEPHLPTQVKFQDKE